MRKYVPGGSEGRAAREQAEVAGEEHPGIGLTEEREDHRIGRGHQQEHRTQDEGGEPLADEHRPQGDAAAAVTHLQQAGNQDPRLLFELAKAQQAAGDAAGARANCEQAANWNALSGTYAYVRADAKEMLGTL